MTNNSNIQNNTKRIVLFVISRLKPLCWSDSPKDFQILCIYFHRISKLFEIFLKTHPS